MAQRVYVIARTVGGRPTLQHRVPDHIASVTCCGLEINTWSRAYMTKRIDPILCKKGSCRA